MPARLVSMRTIAFACVGAAALLAPLLAPAGGAAATANSYTPYKIDLSVGEPSIGYDTNADAALYGAGTDTERLTWDATGKMTQTLVDAPTAQTSLDAITIVDRATHRTFNSQLAGACSLTSYSDDAGATWTPSSGCGVNTLLDHQSLGSGPYHAPLDAVVNPIYPHAVYYCAQNGFNATCARSDDGGVSFGPGSPISNAPGNNGADPLGGSCSGLHGHLRVSADGTVYVPLKGCGGTPSTNNLTNEEYVGGHPTLSVSQDDGTTYQLHMVMAGNNSDESDPSVDSTPDNTVYFGWEDGVNPDDSHDGPTSSARIAVSKDHGATWSTPVDLSSPLGLHNVQFPEVIAGDNGRAAMAFLGTTGVGDDQTNAFRGDWHLYVSTTYDGGATWTTVDATPNDPVQRGCVDMQGIAPGSPRTDVCSQRNMLDFNDITIDKQGRVLVAYTDGCVGACVTDPKKPSTASQDMVMRQSGGMGLLAAYDGALAGQVAAQATASPTPTPQGTAGVTVVQPLPNTSAESASARVPMLLLPLGLGGLVLLGRRRRRRRG
jgi:MYXO-CTERM domain-containing protein